MARHTDANRLSLPVPSSRSYERGKFGRMFPTLSPCIEVTPETLSEISAIANAMIFSDDMQKDPILSTILGDSDTPSGYTYLGQFLIHDISFDLTSINERLVDPEYLWNFRTPALDLDSVYGGGPFLNSYFYEQYENYTGFWLQKTKGPHQDDPLYYDLPRTVTSGKTAVISDLRNDENIILSQIHCAFLQLHNRLSEIYNTNKSLNIGNEMLFKIVQQEIKWMYQWIILYDFLPRIIDMYVWSNEDIEKVHKMEAKEFDGSDNSLLRDTRKLIKALATGKIERKYYEWRNEPFIPLEFSAAAFRFGHSQVRDVYQFNRDPSSNENSDRDNPRFPPRPLFDQTRVIQPRVDLSLFFPENESRGVKNKLVGPRLNGGLTQLRPGILLPGSIADETSSTKNPEMMAMANPDRFNLAWINLKRSVLLKLPSGQSVAKSMSFEPLSINYSAFPDRYRDNTPLWYYILHEAAVQNRGKRLGAVGSVIVAEVITGLLQGDKTSFLNQHPRWIPKDVTGQPNPNFRMADLLKMIPLPKE